MPNLSRGYRKPNHFIIPDESALNFLASVRRQEIGANGKYYKREGSVYHHCQMTGRIYGLQRDLQRISAWTKRKYSIQSVKENSL
jgi:hypothetical protein